MNVEEGVQLKRPAFADVVMETTDGKVGHVFEIKYFRWVAVVLRGKWIGLNDMPACLPT